MEPDATVARSRLEAVRLVKRTLRDMRPLNESAMQVFSVIEKALGPGEIEVEDFDVVQVRLLADVCHLLVNILSEFESEGVSQVVDSLNDLVVTYESSVQQPR